MKKEVNTTDWGKVVAVEYRKVTQLGGSLVVPLTKYLPEGDIVRIIILDMTKNRTSIIIERVND